MSIKRAYFAPRGEVVIGQTNGVTGVLHSGLVLAGS